MIDEPREGSGVGNGTLYSYSEGQADEPLQAAIDLRASSQNAGVIQEMQPNENVIDDKYTVGYSAVDGTDWVVLVHAPYSAVFGFVQDVQQWGLIATGAGVVLIGGVGAILGYSTSSTIDRLTRKTEEMREGNLDVDISSSRIDNIGRLYAGFADMRDSLKTRSTRPNGHGRKQKCPGPRQWRSTTTSSRRPTSSVRPWRPLPPGT